eukprot:5397573-Lingulodinium_polyedra.AAC.1
MAGGGCAAREIAHLAVYLLDSCLSFGGSSSLCPRCPDLACPTVTCGPLHCGPGPAPQPGGVGVWPAA